MGYYIKCSEEQMKMLMEDKWAEGSLERLIESGDIIEVKTPHGRLIDADELLIEDLESNGWINAFGVAVEDLENAPTVIESEVE